jgi:hypothetical protein
MSPKRTSGLSLTCLLLLVSILATSNPLIAAETPRISPVSQERYVETSAGAAAGAQSDGDADYDEAPDHAPFDSAVNSQANASDGSSSAWALSSAGQSSTIGTDWIESHSGTSVVVAGSGQNSLSARGTSEMSVTFMLTEASDYWLQGPLRPAGEVGIEYVSLTGPAGPIHEIYTWWPEDVQEWGSLPAGEYTFEARSNAEINISYLGTVVEGSSNHDVVLQFGPPGWAGPGGEVPDGSDVPGGPPLHVHRLDDGFVRLTWGPSCRGADNDYAVYEGELGDPLSLARVSCSTGGELEYVFQPLQRRGSWFIVVPTDGVTEGSYGDTSEGVERVPSSTACWPQQLGDPVCP